jgi:hypothetical protein
MHGQSMDDLLEPLEQSPSEYRQQQAFAFAQFGAAEHCAVQVLDPLPYLCPKGSCLPVQEGLPVYFDSGHLSERGSRLLIPMFLQSIRAAGDAS